MVGWDAPETGLQIGLSHDLQNAGKMLQTTDLRCDRTAPNRQSPVAGSKSWQLPTDRAATQTASRDLLHRASPARRIGNVQQGQQAQLQAYMARSRMVKRPVRNSAAALKISHSLVRHREASPQNPAGRLEQREKAPAPGQQQYGAVDRRAQLPVRKPGVSRKGRQRRGSVRIKPGELEHLKKIKLSEPVAPVEVVAPIHQYTFPADRRALQASTAIKRSLQQQLAVIEKVRIARECVRDNARSSSIEQPWSTMAHGGAVQYSAAGIVPGPLTKGKAIKSAKLQGDYTNLLHRSASPRNREMELLIHRACPPTIITNCLPSVVSSAAPPLAPHASRNIDSRQSNMSQMERYGDHFVSIRHSKMSEEDLAALVEIQIAEFGELDLATCALSSSVNASRTSSAAAAVRSVR